MSLHIVTTEVRSVLLADGWHTVTRGSFRVDSYEFSTVGAAEFAQARERAPVWSGGGSGFEFEDKDGDLVAGPLSSVLAVSYTAPEKPKAWSFEQLAEKLSGEVVLLDGVETVRFSHADQDFEVWLDEAKQWTFALCGDREQVWQTGLREPETPVYQLLSQMMSEIKGVWGFGRPSGVRDGVEPQPQA
jgi:hypothetical protein